jgi:D-alanyl-D-alanine-carboxypeptidase/D-alanyl-D-alanine-endopeptidase
VADSGAPELAATELAGASPAGAGLAGADLGGAGLAGADLAGVDFGAADRLARAFADRGGQPGLAYGIVAGGRLVHSGGLGERWLGGPVPDAATVFRIASMTKSFTAATVLSLRDEGALRLDDLAQDHVAELGALRLPSTDSPRPTIRNLLTMTAGFPTDDPWGDRQQSLDPAQFAALLASGGVRLGWAPGTRFEYSNLGYALLGKVIEAVTGTGYADTVRRRILDPLGLAHTGFEAGQFDPAQLARGYQRGAGGWAELPFDGYGAFAPMGGVFSTVADLARWVAGFADAFPARDGAQAGHPLSRAARREMQLPQLAIVGWPAGSYPDAATMSYGFGLFVEDGPVFGTMVQHSGGYPGFGSQMRWHPATRTGVIVLGNGTYANVGSLALAILSGVLTQLRAGGLTAASLVSGPGTAAAGAGAVGTGAGSAWAGAGSAWAGAGSTGAGAPGAGRPVVRGPAPGDGGPWPETVMAREEVDRLLAHWDGELAARLFTPNVGWDQPLESRRESVARIRERIGDFAPDPARPPEFDSPSHCRWWLTGDRGTVQAEIGLAPLQAPLVQSLRVAVPPAPGSVLAQMLGTLVGIINDAPASWPAGLPAAADVDTAQLARRLRLVTAWAGRCAPGAYRSGDGESAATVELAGESGQAVLAVGVDPGTGALRQATVTLLP